MTMTALFARGYAKIALEDTRDTFRKRVRLFGDAMDSKSLLEAGVSWDEINQEVQSKHIKYEPNCGIQRRSCGYALTTKGIMLVYKIMKEDYNGQI